MKLLLYPLSIFYIFINYLRRYFYEKKFLKQFKLPTKVISVGNITMGGSGKTPIVSYIAQFLLENGKKVVIVLRGYKRRKKGAILVDKSSSVEEVGEEALIHKLNLNCDVVAAEKRVDALKVLDYIPDYLILDDGFQHLQIKRDKDIVLIDASNLGSFRPYPLGILREPLCSLKKSDVLVVTKGEGKSIPEKIFKFIKEKKLFFARFDWEDFLYPQKIAIKDLKNKKFLLLLAIGNPTHFLNTAKSSGFNVVFSFFFKDHYYPKRKDIFKVIKTFQELNCDFILTSQKDFIKWKKYEEVASKLVYPKIKIIISEKEKFFEEILKDG